MFKYRKRKFILKSLLKLFLFIMVIYIYSEIYILVLKKKFYVRYLINYLIYFFVIYFFSFLFYGVIFNLFNLLSICIYVYFNNKYFLEEFILGGNRGKLVCYN